MLTYPDIDPVIFSIGFLKIRWYGLMYVIGFLFAWWLAKRRCHRSDSPINASASDADEARLKRLIGVSSTWSTR